MFTPFTHHCTLHFFKKFQGIYKKRCKRCKAAMKPRRIKGFGNTPSRIYGVMHGVTSGGDGGGKYLHGN